MKTITALTFALAGFALFDYGAYLAWKPLGFLLCGAESVAFAALVATGKYATR